MPRHPDILRRLAPRGLNRRQAAEYVGVGPSTFDKMVADGRMPPPRRVNSLTIWDRLDLDESFAALPYDNRASHAGAGEGERGGWNAA